MDKAKNFYGDINNFIDFEKEETRTNTNRDIFLKSVRFISKSLHQLFDLLRLNLGLIRKASIIMLATLAIGFIVGMDISERLVFYSQNIPHEEIQEFSIYKSLDQVKADYSRNFFNTNYSFPRTSFTKAIFYKNSFLTSQFTSKTLEEKEALQLVELLNEPSNFDWRESDWTLREAEYIIRFFDINEKEIGKVWLCTKGCSMIKALPFSPNMKFGGMSQEGVKKMDDLIKQILDD